MRRRRCGGAEREATGANTVGSVEVGWIGPADFGGPFHLGSERNIPLQDHPIPLTSQPNTPKSGFIPSHPIPSLQPNTTYMYAKASN